MNNIATTSPKRGWRISGLTFWWVMLAATVALSSYGNVKHAEMVTPDEYLSIGRFIAAALPLSLLLMVEGIALAERAGASGRARLVGMSVVSILAVVVFAASYVGLLSVVAPTQLLTGTVSPLNYGLAAVPDLLMAASTVYLMSMRASARTAVEEPAAKSSTRSALGKIGGNYMQRWVNSSAPKPQVEHVVEVREAPVESSVEPAVESMATSAEPIEPAVEPSAEHVVEDASSSVDAFVETSKSSTKTSAKPPVKVTKPAVKVSKPSVDPELLPFMDAANWMVKEGIVARKTAVELAQVIAAVERRESPNRIKTDLGISPSTTAKVSAAWADWNRRDDVDDQEDAEQPELVGAVA